MDSKKRNIIVQFVKFNIVGITNTFITYCIYSVLVIFGVNHFIALGFDYLFGIIITFVLNKHFTFKHKYKTTVFIFLKMVVIYIFVFFINSFLLYIFIDINKFNKLVSQFFAQGAVALMSFIFQKNIVFRSNGGKR